MASPLLAEIFLAVAGMGGDPAAIDHEDRLMEHAFGDWEGLLWADVERAQAYQEAGADWWQEGVFPPAESLEALRRIEARYEDHDPRRRKQLISALKSFTRSYRNSHAAKLARQRIAELGG